MAAPTANFPDVQRIRDIVRNELAALLDSVRDYHEDTSFIFTHQENNVLSHNLNKFGGSFVNILYPHRTQIQTIPTFYCINKQISNL